MKPHTDQLSEPPQSADTTAGVADVSDRLAGESPVAEARGESTSPETRTAATPPWPRLSLNRRDQRWLLFLGILFFAVTGMQWVRMTRPPAPLPWQRSEAFDRLFRVDVNNATWIEWSQLEGIGPGYAHRIVADRQVNGPFSSVDDVTRVPGIGKAMLDRVRPWLTISHESDTSHARSQLTRPASDQSVTERSSPVEDL